MKLQSVQIFNLFSFIDSGEVEIEDTLTCCIGKNETGKTSFLKCLYSIGANQERSQEMLCFYSEVEQRFKQGELEEREILVVNTKFELNKRDIEKLRLYHPILKSIRQVEIEYFLGSWFSVLSGDLNLMKLGPALTDEKNIIRRLLANLSNEVLKQKDENEFGNFYQEQKKVIELIDTIEYKETIDIIKRVVSTLDDLSSKYPDLSEEINNCKEQINEVLNEINNKPENAGLLVLGLQPNFLMFDEIDRLQDSVNISEFLENPDSNLTLKNLFMLANLDVERLSKLDSISRIRDIRRASARVSGPVNKAWRQEEVELQFGVDGDNLFVTIIDETGEPTLPSKRSKGFQWFLSFYINFQVGSRETFENCIILLDDPGVYLHPFGQRDLLETLEKLAKKNQIIYVTHSPFLIDRDKLERIRIFEKIGDKGTQIRSGFQSSASDALEPVRAAIGMKIGDTLFGTKNNIIVEGFSDYLILNLMLNNLKSSNQFKSIPEDLAIVPIGGAGKIPYFATIFWKEKFNYVIVLDYDEAGRQARKVLQEALVHEGKILLLDDIFKDFGNQDFEIEDLISTELYTEAVNQQYSSSLTKVIQISDIDTSKKPITSQFEAILQRQGIKELNKLQVTLRLCKLLDAAFQESKIDKRTNENFKTLLATLISRLNQ